MDLASSIALSRLVVQQRALDVAAGNVANAGTAGYRGARVMYSDWIARNRGAAGTPPPPPGAQGLTYVQDRATWRVPQPGPTERTGNPLDLALGGSGYFTVQTADGPRLTRAGHFELSSQGRIVDLEGDALLDPAGRPLTLAQGSLGSGTLTIAADGTIASDGSQVGRIGVVDVPRPTDLLSQGDWLYRATAPTTPVAAPAVVQGAVEGSNVQPIRELSDMLSGQRDFEFTTQLLQAEGEREQSAIDKILARPA